ncbi:MAG: response regulator [Chitinispirillaceae bacterium]|nr:response regulator [Chitinispirillaceae bacterium]
MTTLPDKNRGAPATVLIVDDDADMLSLIKALMDEAGFTALGARSGREALELVQHKKPDLVLLDVLMPDLSGIEVAERIKKEAGKDFLPIIMISALCSDEDKVKGLNFADDYLTKPFSAEELRARVNSLLRIRNLHKELTLSKTRYESLYENFPHLYLSIDSNRIITECNRFFRDAFDVKREEIVGKSFYTLFREQDRPLVENCLNSFNLSDLPSIGQRTFSILREAPAPPLQLSLKAVYTGAVDDDLNTVIAMEDVTEQVRLQEEQRIARQQLYRSARLASIGTLASGVAHEINNPLTAILGSSSALLARINNNELIERNDLEEYLGIINMEALRCRDIVETLSKFARESDVAKTAVNLRQCVEDAVKLTYMRTKRASLNVVNSVDSAITIRGNANRLEQVFVNIIANCIDFCPGGSTVFIDNVPANEPGRNCRARIRDNGPGIGTDILPKVFDPFFTTKEVGKGTGMGLAICYKIMEECNGHIDISSERGEGTTVFLEIPLA